MRIIPSSYLRILWLLLLTLGHPLGDSASAGTWTELPNTKIQDVGPPNPPPPSGSLTNVINAWSGAAMDTINNRLFIWGGGHNDYAGNEIYVLNLNTQSMERFWGPSPSSDEFWGGSCPTNPLDSKLSDGTPISRHTYGGLVYLEHVNLFLIFGGSRACGSGGFGRDTWTFDPSTNQWNNEFPSGSTPEEGVMITAYDPVTKKVFFQRSRGLFTYEYGASKTSRVNTWTKLNDKAIAGYDQMSGTIDPVRRKLVLVGGASSPGTYLIDIDSSNNSPQKLTTTNGGVIESAQAPGIAYDPNTDRILAWDGSRLTTNTSTVWSLNVDTGTWTLVHAEGSGMSVNTGSTGTYGRWRYAPSIDKFVAVISIDQNARLYSNSGPAGQDTLPPTISVTGPTQNSTVSGNVTIAASASDNTGVLGVQFKVNGVDVGPEDTHSPFSVIWDTTALQEGNYNLTAVARDAGGNSKTSTAVTVTVSSINPDPPPPPPPAGTGYLDIPVNTWVPRLLSTDRTKAPSGGKHIRWAHNPDDGLIYKQGGDHAGTPGLNVPQSSRNEMYTYDILTDTWTMTQPYCRTDGTVQPGGSDEHGWSWDPNRKVFWLVPGYSNDVSGGICTQSTLINPPMMYYSPTTRVWTYENRKNLEDFGFGTMGSHKFSQYDAVNDELIMMAEDAVLIYNINDDNWRKIKFTGLGKTLRLKVEYSAIDLVDRVIYGVDRANPRLARYDMDAQTMEILATPPSTVYTQSQVYWDSVNRVLLWFDHNQPSLGVPNPGRLHVYHPDSDTWEVDKIVDHSLVPPGVIVRGNSGVFDPIQNVLMVLGGLEPSNPYIFLYRYADGSGGPPDITPPLAPKNLTIN